MSVFILKMCWGVKPSQSDLCRWDQWNLSMWSVSGTATPKVLCPREGIFSRKSGGSMDKNKEIGLPGELLANLCHGDFSITLALLTQTSMFCQNSTRVKEFGIESIFIFIEKQSDFSLLSPSKILFYSYIWAVWLPLPPCPYPDLGYSETNIFCIGSFCFTVYSNFFWSGAETTLFVTVQF